VLTSHKRRVKCRYPSRATDRLLSLTMEATFEWELPYEWTNHLSWEGLAFTLYFARPITAAEEEQLRRGSP